MRMKKRIFYFNITYGCNSNCVFCYSHNTKHDSLTYREINKENFFEYLDENKLSTEDRVIINGGEPLIHTQIMEILEGLIKYGCEVLIYTNGRLLQKYNFSNLNSNFRFVIPIHGNQDIHDKITGICGSYKETVDGLIYLNNTTNCPIDIKIILNKYMLDNYDTAKSFLEKFDEEITFNNAIHLTKMADTIVSRRNRCESLDNNQVSNVTDMYIDYFRKKNVPIKIFDTCIKTNKWLKNKEIVPYNKEIIVYFKDKDYYRVMNLDRRETDCMHDCEIIDKCKSAVDTYKVLEIYNEKIYENLE